MRCFDSYSLLVPSRSSTRGSVANFMTGSITPISLKHVSAGNLHIVSSGRQKFEACSTMNAPQGGYHDMHAGSTNLYEQPSINIIEQIIGGKRRLHSTERAEHHAGRALLQQNQVSRPLGGLSSRRVAAGQHLLGPCREAVLRCWLGLSCIGQACRGLQKHTENAGALLQDIPCLCAEVCAPGIRQHPLRACQQRRTTCKWHRHGKPPSSLGTVHCPAKQPTNQCQNAHALPFSEGAASHLCPPALASNLTATCRSTLPDRMRGLMPVQLLARLSLAATSTAPYLTLRSGVEVSLQEWRGLTSVGAPLNKQNCGSCPAAHIARVQRDSFNVLYCAPRKD
jgi:hypothetical protein